MTGPISAIRKGSHKLAQGDLSTRIDEKTSCRSDEIGELARGFNQMAEQVEELLGAQQRLLQDISHELRSPLTRLQLALAIARKKSSGVAEKELDRIGLERERLEGLIQQILTLSRLENLAAPDMDPLDLVLLIKDTLQQGSLEAEQRNITLKYNGPDTANYNGNQQLLFSVIDNLLRNAIRHSPDNGTITIELFNKSQAWTIILSD
jgi:two-component system sensor histidine kinase CpxA